MKVDFVHESGQHDISSELDQILSSATHGFKIAVAFLTAAAVEILGKHKRSLNLPESFITISVAFPTDLKAVYELYRLAPGHVYLHLGGKTPNEVGVGRALMHSKVILSNGENECALWVGSQNLTASAIKGANFEAAIKLVISGEELKSNKILQNAETHLQRCRNTAEAFDPDRRNFYEALQQSQAYQQLMRIHFGYREDILVIHCEDDRQPLKPPFIAELRTSTEVQGELVRTGEKVHLYTHDIGSLNKSGNSIENSSGLYTGEVTGVLHTEHNQKHPGRRGKINADVFIDVNGVPRIARQGDQTFQPKSQILVRLDRRERDRTNFLYSVATNPPLGPPELIADDQESIVIPTTELGPYLRYFTEESCRGSALVYQPIKEVRREVRLSNPFPLSERQVHTLHSIIRNEKRLNGYSVEVNSNMMPSNILQSSIELESHAGETMRHRLSETTPYVFVSRYSFRDPEANEHASLSDFE